MNTYSLFFAITVIGTMQLSHHIQAQPIKDSELRITQNLATGELKYERKKKDGSFLESSYLHVRRDGKIVITSTGNPFRFAFKPTKVEVTINKSFGDSLTGPFSIKGLPGLSLPDGTQKAKALNESTSSITKKLTSQEVKADQARNNEVGILLNTLLDFKKRSDGKATQYATALSSYKQAYLNLYTGLIERKKLIDEKKFFIDDAGRLTTTTKEIFDGFFAPFGNTPSVSLNALITDYAQQKVADLKKSVDDDATGLKKQTSDLRELLSTIKVLGNRILDEYGDKLKDSEKQQVKDVVTAAQQATADLDKANSDVVKRHEIVTSTDWVLEFTRFWQTKEEILSANFTHVFTTSAKGDKMDIRQSYKIMKFQDGKLTASPPELDTTFVVQVKGTMHINISAGVGLPFLTENSYSIKPDKPTSATAGTLVQDKVGLGSPYLVTMFDVSWGNYSQINPVISAGLGYPLSGGSLAVFGGGGVAFEVLGRRMLFHGGIAYVKSNVLSGGYVPDDSVPVSFEIPTENGYRIKPFFAFTYNLAQVK
ncbi:hypothetical protein [Spirosoma endophyticum]|uniref:Uncharacterized protein n=1 Tax=Spirosoma endophyticum TaxID=662367 RepID=A0A1I2GE29_9BACT|nr:hypothetical protein [Spirosoma endophyticum]SFF15458.1 hypothetical protein SAMN05216167_13141 [Spirosoma endophyticum]